MWQQRRNPDKEIYLVTTQRRVMLLPGSESESGSESKTLGSIQNSSCSDSDSDTDPDCRSKSGHKMC